MNEEQQQHVSSGLMKIVYDCVLEIWNKGYRLFEEYEDMDHYWTGMLNLIPNLTFTSRHENDCLKGLYDRLLDHVYLSIILKGPLPSVCDYIFAQQDESLSLIVSLSKKLESFKLADQQH